MAFIDDEFEQDGITESRRVVDDSYKTNASYANNAGLETTVERSYDGVGLHNGKDPCKWCIERAGIWSYGEAYQNGVWSRHDGCGCEIIYNCARGSMRQTDWRSNKWTDVLNRDKIEARKIYDTYNQPNKKRLIHYRTGDMTTEEWTAYKRELNAVQDAEQIWLEKDEYAMVMSEFNTHMSAEDRKHAIVSKPIGNYWYTIINRGFDNYTVIGKRPIDSNIIESF